MEYEIASAPDLRIKTATGPTILLASGHYFDLLDPANSRFTLGDIALGLGNTCRFAGQCDRFYSVAEHSWYASFLIGNPALAFAALMHDAQEAFIGDVTRPLKSLLPEYKKIEKRIEAVLADRYGFAWAADDPAIKQVDLRLLAAEQGELMPAHDDTWACLAGVDVPEIEWRFWSPVEATGNWLRRAAFLLGLATEVARDLERVA